MRQWICLAIILISGYVGANGESEAIASEKCALRVASRLERLRKRSHFYSLEKGDTVDESFDSANPLILPPNSERYLSASLVKDKHSEWFLAIGGYRIQHSTLHELFADMNREGLIEDFYYEWLGELKVVNRTPLKAVGKIVVANEVSGFFKDVVEPLRHQDNDIQTLVKVLSARKKSPVRFARRFEAISWKESEQTGSIHLFPGLDELMTGLADGKSYRHFMLNKSTSLLHTIARAFGDTSIPTDDARLAEIEEKWVTPFKESVRKNIEILGNDGVVPAEFPRLRELFMQEHLSLEEWREINAILDRSLMLEQLGAETLEAHAEKSSSIVLKLGKIKN